jgi:flavin reductase (DIM6/NTAB) family NADH-FMN oxidoreductase RutF
MVKVSVRLSSSYRLLHPRPVVLITCCSKDGKNNIIAVAWSTPLSFNPPLVGISIAPKRYSYKLIKETKEFVVNVPSAKLAKETLICGKFSGRNVEKFKMANLTPLQAKKVKPPLIKECVAHLECKVVSSLDVGDHVFFVGKVLNAEVEEELFNREESKYRLSYFKPLIQLGGEEFTTTKEETFILKV